MDHSYALDLERSARFLLKVPLQEPYRYVLHFVAVAGLSQAAVVDLEAGEGYCQIDYLGMPLSEADLTSLHEGHSRFSDDPRQRELNQSVMRALSLPCQSLELLTWGREGGLRLSWDGLATRCEQIQPRRDSGARLRVERRCSGPAPELQLGADHCANAPFAVRLQGQPINRTIQLGSGLVFRVLQGPLSLAITAAPDPAPLLCERLNAPISGALSLMSPRDYADSHLILIRNGVSESVPCESHFTFQAALSLEGAVEESACLEIVLEHLEQMSVGLMRHFATPGAPDKGRIVPVLLQLARHRVAQAELEAAEAILSMVSGYQQQQSQPDPLDLRLTVAAVAELKRAQGHLGEALSHYRRIVDSYLHERDTAQAAAYLEDSMQLQIAIDPQGAVDSLVQLAELLSFEDVTRSRAMVGRALELIDPQDSRAGAWMLRLRALGSPEQVEQISTLLGMQARRVCPSCGGESLIRDLRLEQSTRYEVHHQGRAVGPLDLTILTDVCGSCGYLFQRAAHPQQTMEQYRKLLEGG